MNELHEKLGSGLNKLQDSLQTNKQKIQNAQDANQHKRMVQETSLKRNEILLQLGEEVYKKLRSKDIESEELSKKVMSLIELDRTIYHSQQAISAYEAHSTDEKTCGACGTLVTSEDKFCGGCGAKVEQSEQKLVVETVNCTVCEEAIPVNAAFCSCCGTKQETISHVL